MSCRYRVFKRIYELRNGARPAVATRGLPQQFQVIIEIIIEGLAKRDRSSTKQSIVKDRDGLNNGFDTGFRIYRWRLANRLARVVLLAGFGPWVLAPHAYGAEVVVQADSHAAKTTHTAGFSETQVAKAGETRTAGESGEASASSRVEANDTLAAEINTYSDKELTALAGRWGLLSEPQRDALLQETRDRMHRHLGSSEVGRTGTYQESAQGRPSGRVRFLSPRELNSLALSRQGQQHIDILSELPALVAYMRSMPKRRSLGARTQNRVRAQNRVRTLDPKLAVRRSGEIRVQRRYGRKIVRRDGSVVQRVQTRVIRVTGTDPSRAFGRMGFERRHYEEAPDTGLEHTENHDHSDGAASVSPDVIRVKDRSP